MSIDQLQDAVRAGYTSNDPFNNLGLFGVGFNIATARLGEETTIISTRRGDADWVGVKIDFQQLIDSRRFDAPIIRKTKNNPNECGTKITIGKIKSGILAELSTKETEIRKRLELVYAPLLSARDITITVRNKQLRSQMHCTWSESRYVRYNNQNVPARINIDRVLGAALFDVTRNRYLIPDEAEEYYEAQQEGEALPTNIVEREKRLTGWLPKEIAKETVLQYPFPEADGCRRIWHNPVTIQHPLAEIEIIARDSTLTVVISKDDHIAGLLREQYVLAKDLKKYNE